MATQYKFKIWCNTENAWVVDSGYREDAPTTCPSNNEHTIDTAKTVILDEHEEQVVTISGETHHDGRLSFINTPRPMGTMTHFTSYGDDHEQIGEGIPAVHLHRPGQPAETSLYLDFHSLDDDNRVWLHDAFCSYEDCQFDTVEVEIVPRVQTYSDVSPGSTNYNIDPGSGIIIPAAPGTGNVSLTGHPIHLVEMLPSQRGVRPTAFWNGDWDPVLKSYINVTPSYDGTGNYNMFTVETELMCFVRWVLTGSNSQKLGTYDAEPLGHNQRLKFIFSTYIDSNVDDHRWSMAVNLELFRSKTV
jgi:hypothetical protein